MTIIRLNQYSGSTNVLVTEISGLANNSISGLSGTGTGTLLDNTSLLALYADIVLAVTFTAAPTIGNTLGLYAAYSMDGLNYDTVVPAGTTAPQLLHLVNNFPIATNNVSQWITIRRAPLIPGKMKFHLYNTSGMMMGGTSCIVTVYPYALQSN